jgi:hypothetical protein
MDPLGPLAILPTYLRLDARDGLGHPPERRRTGLIGRALLLRDPGAADGKLPEGTGFGRAQEIEHSIDDAAQLKYLSMSSLRASSLPASSARLLIRLG